MMQQGTNKILVGSFHVLELILECSFSCASVIHWFFVGYGLPGLPVLL